MNHPHHRFLLFFIPLLMMVILVVHDTFAVKVSTLATEAAFMKANNVRLLGQDEFAVTISSQSQKNGAVDKSTITLSDGTIISIDVPKGSTLSITEPTPNGTTYVATNDPHTRIYNMYDFIRGFDSSGKIETAIEKKIKKQGKVRVIVQMKLPYDRFYEKNQSSDRRLSKEKMFLNTKTSVLKSIGNAGTLKRDLKIVNAVALEVSERALEGLRNNPNVQNVFLDREMQMTLDTSLDEINVKHSWAQFDNNQQPISGNGIKVAILDTGVDYTHPDLGGCLGVSCKVIGGYNFINNNTDPMDDVGHGTHIAAIAAGNGIFNGVAPDAKILAYKVRSATVGTTSSVLIAASEKALSDGAHIVNISFGSYCGAEYSLSCGPMDLNSQTINNLSAMGVVAVVAAGNYGPLSANPIFSPAVAETAITVAAGCEEAQMCGNPVASFSSRGPVLYNGIDYKKPDITAPGVSICAALARFGAWFSSPEQPCLDDKHIIQSGTSMASPHIVGVAALLKQANPSYTPAQIKERLKSTARPLSGMTYNDQGAGMVDVKSAIPAPVYVSTNPDMWKITTDPTVKHSVHTQTISVTPQTPIGNLSLGFSSPVQGITFSSNKEILTVSSGTPDSFVGTITVDNDIVKNGSYTTVIYFSENGVKKGAIPVIVTVSPTIVISPSVINYGTNTPSLATWQSNIIPVTLINKRKDISQTVSLSSSSFVSGIVYTISTPSVSQYQFFCKQYDCSKWGICGNS
jgi:subtilisin family serine protease